MSATVKSGGKCQLILSSYNLALLKAAMSCPSNKHVCTRSLHSLASMAARPSRSLRRPCALNREMAPNGLMTRYCSTVGNSATFPGSSKDVSHAHSQGLLQRDHSNNPVHSRALEATLSPVPTRESISSYQTSHHVDQQNITAPGRWETVSSTPAARPMAQQTMESKALARYSTPDFSVLLAGSLTRRPKPKPKFFSHNLRKSPKGKDVLVHYCKSLKTSEKIAQHFLNDKTLGFDMEWKAQASAFSGIKNNVSLIQIANQERIALFHIAKFPGKRPRDLVPPTLKQIIQNPDITKVGVSIKADCTRLHKFLGIEARGIFELSHLHKLIKYCHTDPGRINKRTVNLSEQVEEHLGLPLEKVDDVRCSNWAASLSYRQVQYAAADSYACVCLFHAMDAKRKALDPTPPLPAHADLDLPIQIVSEPAVATDNDDVEVVKS
ncbi:3'-5' exonuclease [Aspergillus ibericus CBS 121593]|uniref:Ribonuclease H-like protein n=1 Tax=Aspergillus ibericus CBS 121593 TaxID=1448316 RepID=A0A395GXD7_9EURO|nr:ribonuclease H-like protein [Aspergillus ibericus CBS 121593]RAK99698.1 ribonuclease H-like protein [Aspergillus ibericus CBS 121593]